MMLWSNESSIATYLSLSTLLGLWKEGDVKKELTAVRQNPLRFKCKREQHANLLEQRPNSPQLEIYRVNKSV